MTEPQEKPEGLTSKIEQHIFDTYMNSYEWKALDELLNNSYKHISTTDVEFTDEAMADDSTELMKLFRKHYTRPEDGVQVFKLCLEVSGIKIWIVGYSRASWATQLFTRVMSRGLKKDAGEVATIGMLHGYTSVSIERHLDREDNIRCSQAFVEEVFQAEQKNKNQTVGDK